MTERSGALQEDPLYMSYAHIVAKSCGEEEEEPEEEESEEGERSAIHVSYNWVWIVDAFVKISWFNTNASPFWLIKFSMELFWVNSSPLFEHFVRRNHSHFTLNKSFF